MGWWDPGDMRGVSGSLIQLPGVLGSRARGCQESPGEAMCTSFSHRFWQVAPRASPSPASTTGRAMTTSAATPALAPQATRAGTAPLVSPHLPCLPNCRWTPRSEQRVLVGTQFQPSSPLTVNHSVTGPPTFQTHLPTVPTA